MHIGNRTLVGVSLAGVATLLMVMFPVPAHAAPAQPPTPIAVAGDTSATVFVQKNLTGTSPSTIDVTAVEDNSKTCIIPTAVGRCVVLGLTPGVSYTFTAVANNGGASPTTLPSVAVVPGPCTQGAQDFAGGSGTVADPFEIATATQLENVRKYNMSCHYELTADITLTGEWTPIGYGIRASTGTYDSAGFSGTFDGTNKAITGMSITSNVYTSTFAGLFGVIDGGVVRDLNVSNAVVSRSGSASGGNQNGLLAGRVIGASLIDNVNTSGIAKGDNHVGGLVGLLGGTSEVINSSSNAALDTDYVYHAWNIGGLVGMATDSCVIRGSFATGTVRGVTFTGGLIGGIWLTASGGCLVEESYATGDVIARRANAGGLVGLMNTPDATSNEAGTIRNSFATGDVSSTNFYGNNGFDLGGLVGLIYKSPTSRTNVIENSYATGTVSTTYVGASLNRLGGLVGSIQATGGNTTEPSVVSSFWNPTDSGPAALSTIGAQSTQAAMKSIALYSDGGWSISASPDGSKKWLIDPAENGGYPIPMRWTVPPTAPSSGSSPSPSSESSPVETDTTDTVYAIDTPSQTQTPAKLVRVAQSLGTPLKLPKRIPHPVTRLVLLKQWHYTTSDQKLTPHVRFMSQRGSGEPFGEVVRSHYRVRKSGKVVVILGHNRPTAMKVTFSHPGTTELLPFSLTRTIRVN